jgi:hypothetical protein
LVTFDSSELVLIKILYFGSNLLNVGSNGIYEIYGLMGEYEFVDTVWF